MTVRYCTIVLAGLLIPLLAIQPAMAASKAEREAAKRAKFAEEVKTGIATLGVGPDSWIKLTLRDKRKIDGYVTEVRDDAVVVMDKQTATQTVVPYPDVTKVQGNNLSMRTKIIIWSAVAAGIIITLVITKGAFCDGC
jgi:hypothetical protein